MVGSASERTDRPAECYRGVARKRNGINPHQVCPRRRTPPATSGAHLCSIIGIDPHKGSHTAAAVDRHKVVIDTIRVDADRHKRARLLAWASRFEPSSWAVEGATGMGAVLAQQLVAAGEHVVDVPPKLSSRARLLESGRSDKTDPNDARSAANVVASERLAAGRVPHVHEPLVHVCGLSGVADSPHHLGHAPIRGGRVDRSFDGWLFGPARTFDEQNGR